MLWVAEHNGKTKVLVTIFIQYEALSQKDYEMIDNDILPKFSQDVQKRWSERYLPSLKELVESS